MSNFGTINQDGNEYTLTQEADYSNRVFPGWYGDAQEGESYTAEFSAAAVDANGDTHRVYWQFDEVKGQERADAGSYDWSDVAFIRPE